MYKGPCSVPNESRFLYDKYISSFQKKIQAENLKVQSLHNEEVKSTLENPRVREINETTDISKQLISIKHDDHVTEKRRQQLRENTEELRQLENALRAAHITRQVAEQQYTFNNRTQEKIRLKREEERKEEATRRKLLALDQQKMLEDLRKKNDLRSTLLKQMAERQQRLMMLQKEKLRDRENMKELLRRCQEENEQEKIELQKRKERAKQEIQEFMESQQRIKNEQLAQKAGENIEYLEMMRIRDEKLRKEKEYKNLLLEHRQAISDNIGRRINEEKAIKSARWELIQDLLMEEAKAKEERQRLKIEHKQAMEREHCRLEAERYHEHTLITKKCSYLSEEDKMFYDEEMRCLAERDKLEQISAERRRKLQNEHRRATLQMMEENRQKRAQANAEKLREHEILVAQQRKHDEEVEAERLRMLCQHPSEVLRYVPATLITDKYREMLGLPPNSKKN